MKFFGHEIGDAEEFLKDIEQIHKNYWTTPDGYYIDADDDSINDFLASVIEWRMAKLNKLKYYYIYISTDGTRIHCKYWRSVFAKNKNDAKIIAQKMSSNVKVVDAELATKDSTIHTNITL